MPETLTFRTTRYPSNTVKRLCPIFEEHNTCFFCTYNTEEREKIDCTNGHCFYLNQEDSALIKNNPLTVFNQQFWEIQIFLSKKHYENLRNRMYDNEITPKYDAVTELKRARITYARNLNSN